MKMAESSGSAKFQIDPNDSVFLKPGMIDDSMPDRIKSYCKNNGQYVPQSISEIARGIFESLADIYAKTISEIEDVSNKKIEELYIIGGGSQNSLLCELTAKKTGIPVFAGPVEATAIGNILIQMISEGEIESIKEGRMKIKEAYDIKEFRP